MPDGMVSERPGPGIRDGWHPSSGDGGRESEPSSSHYKDVSIRIGDYKGSRLTSPERESEIECLRPWGLYIDNCRVRIWRTGPSCESLAS